MYATYHLCRWNCGGNASAAGGCRRSRLRSRRTQDMGGTPHVELPAPPVSVPLKTREEHPPRAKISKIPPPPPPLPMKTCEECPPPRGAADVAGVTSGIAPPREDVAAANGSSAAPGENAVDGHGHEEVTAPSPRLAPPPGKPGDGTRKCNVQSTSRCLPR